MWTRTRKSGTEQFPHPQDLIEALLKELLGRQDHGIWLHLEAVRPNLSLLDRIKGVTAFVELISTKSGEIEVNLGLPEKTDDSTVYCTNRGVSIPEDWTHSEGYVYLAPLRWQGDLPQWIHDFFVKIYGCTQGFELKGWIEGI